MSNIKVVLDFGLGHLFGIWHLNFVIIEYFQLG
jgi:hypothetical protein